MIRRSSLLIVSFAMLAISADQAAAQRTSKEKECSTERVNDDCTVTIDRSYPVVLPTIQMRPTRILTVRIVHSLPF
jgi:hypothetical protein